MNVICAHVNFLEKQLMWPALILENILGMAHTTSHHVSSSKVLWWCILVGLFSVVHGQISKIWRVLSGFLK